MSLTFKEQEALYARMRGGLEARSELAASRPALLERREGLIIQAVLDYQKKDPVTGRRVYTEMDAILFVAALVENQRLLDDLESAVRMGDRAAKRLANQSDGV
jgi:hypothetical protein